MVSSSLKKGQALVYFFSALLWLLLPLAISFAEIIYRVNSNNINVRADSTINAAIICKVNRGDEIEVISEFYDWYKIRLPRSAGVFIKKNLVALRDEKTARVLGDNVNLRLSPNEKSPILGKANKDENFVIVKDSGEWYGVLPSKNSLGWVYKKFIDKVDAATSIKKEATP